MKFVILVVLLIAYLHAEEDSCYTVQIVSATSSYENYYALSSETYDTTCKLMDINNLLTVRCGCYDNVQDAKMVLKKYRPIYKDAYIRTTYRYRFAEQHVDTPVQV